MLSTGSSPSNADGVNVEEIMEAENVEDWKEELVDQRKSETELRDDSSRECDPGRCKTETNATYETVWEAISWPSEYMSCTIP